MKLMFFSEARLRQTKDGMFYSSDQSYSCHMFNRYLNVFEKIFVVARTAIDANGTADGNTAVGNDRVEVLPLPYYVGPYQYLRMRVRLLAALKYYIDNHPNTAVICRIPGTIGFAAIDHLLKINKPYAVEVVGDPYDVFSPHSIKHPLRLVFQHCGVSDMKIALKGAAASIYVTKEYLQARYSSNNKGFSTYASNVMLPPSAFVETFKSLRSQPPYSILAIGSLSAMYKAPDVAIEAMVILKQRGIGVTLQWLGEGRYKREMIDLARQADVSDITTFVGNVASAAEVRSYLDAADLYIMPSRVEGLPRALIEAMARGLPCIGTATGGIPELLNGSALVPVNNPKMLADKITSFLTIPGLADAQAKRNLTEARSYAQELLDARRTEFYRYLANI